MFRKLGDGQDDHSHPWILCVDLQSQTRDRSQSQRFVGEFSHAPDSQTTMDRFAIGSAIPPSVGPNIRTRLSLLSCDRFARLLCCLFVDLIWRNLLYLPVERETLFRLSLSG